MNKIKELKKGLRSIKEKKKKNIQMVIATLTLRTSLAWNSGVQLWWIKPMPPVSWGEDNTSVCAIVVTGTINS